MLYVRALLGEGGRTDPEMFIFVKNRRSSDDSEEPEVIFNNFDSDISPDASVHSPDEDVAELSPDETEEFAL